MNALEKLAVRYPQKRVLITGATSGLGEALALRFAGGGFRVAVASRNPEKVKHTVQRLEACGSGALPITLDVTREEDFHAALELSLIHISEPTKLWSGSRMPSSA